MKELKQLFEDLGFSEVKTYIQSGNVIFNAETAKEGEISKTVENAIFDRYSYEVPVICRTAEELQQSIVENPFFEDTFGEIEKLYLTFLKAVPGKEQLEELKKYDFSPDEFIVKGKNVFIYCSGRYSQSKLSNNFFESKLKVKATTRNWKTVLKLAELV